MFLGFDVRKEACIFVHNFGTCHIVGENNSGSAQNRFYANQSEWFVQ